MSLHSFRPLVLAGLAALLPATAAAQQADSGAFVVRLGKDTLSVERFVRNRQELVAEAVLRTPQTRRMKLTVTYNDNGDIAWFEVVNSPVKGVPHSTPITRTVISYAGDSARVETWIAAVPRQSRALPVSPDMLPLQPPFYSTYEAALEQLHFTGDSARMTMLAASGPYTYSVHRLGGDSLSLYAPVAGTIHVHVDRNHHLMTLNGFGTTFKVVATRTKWLDLDRYAERFAARDAEGKSVGVLSPRDTVDEAIDNTDLTIDYSRPSKRGRIVFGGLVPWGEVWRTGANAATQIEFNTPLTIAGVKVPAGKYTMWSIPGPRQWQLILNKQTGQWGTEYDAKRDLVRIPLKPQTLTVPVETFTISTKPTGKKSEDMILSWDRTRLVVPIVAP